MEKRCIGCGKIIKGGWGNRVRCGTIKGKTGCSYKNYKNNFVEKEKTLLQKIKSLYQYNELRTNCLFRENFYCQDCGEKGRRKGIDVFIKLPILFVLHTTFNDIIKKYSITSEKEALVCEELWKSEHGKVLCTDCFYKNKLKQKQNAL